LHWIIGGLSTTNVLHGNYTGGGALDGTMAEALFSGFKTQLTLSNFNAQLAVGTQFVAVGLRDLRTAHLPEYMSTGSLVAGADATGAMPSSVAIAVTLLTAQAGRGYRGRSYFGGLGLITTQDARTFNAAAGQAAVDFMEGIMSTMQTNGMPLGVAQRALLAGTDANGNPMPARGASIIPVTAAILRDHRFDSQRNRLGR